ncbi:RNA-binding protein [Candidatus Micrarchaeota archaeon]|nr:RNA-binding protein [Candidatus Micrarchaeota archaeon]MBD3417812.1 RNA-binding protein [Candidatus Micrarchaeota archaeon]
MAKRCSTCGKMANKFAEFPCPGCGEHIVRCYHCREIRNKYTCKCGFEGP